MKNWFNRNYRTLIISAFVVPIIIVALVSISHVTVWYDITNPSTWATYLSIGIEIAALSALAAISANMGRKVYFPFIIVTLIQFIGNIFFSYQYIDINSKLFKDWVELVSPLISLMGIEENDILGHKRFLALFSGGLMPLISLSFLHMIVKFAEQTKNEIDIKPQENPIKNIYEDSNDEKLQEVKKFYDKIEDNDIVTEITRLRLSEDELKEIENILLKKESDNNQNNELLEEKIDENKKDTESSSNESSEETIPNEEQILSSYDFENEEGEPVIEENYNESDIENTNEIIEDVNHEIVDDDKIEYIDTSDKLLEGETAQQNQIENKEESIDNTENVEEKKN
jgi:hypothetical protein